jgi:hypothetical protein
LLIGLLRLLNLSPNVDVTEVFEPQADKPANPYKANPYKPQTEGPATSCFGNLCNNVGQQESAVDDYAFTWCQELSDLPRPNLQVEPQKWQNVEGRNLTVFSSYLDARTSVGGPMIRVIASGLQEFFNEIGDLYCLMWYPDSDIPMSFGPAIYDLIYPSTLHGEMWVAHFVLCNLPSTKLAHGTPFAVSITGERCSAKTGNQLIVKAQEQQPLTKNPSFALCLPVTYGRYLSNKKVAFIYHWNRQYMTVYLCSPVLHLSLVCHSSPRGIIVFALLQKSTIISHLNSIFICTSVITQNQSILLHDLSTYAVPI